MRTLRNPWATGGEYWKANALQNSVLNQDYSNITKNSDSRIRTIRNASKATIWCKNEKDCEVFALDSGEITSSRIDGITLWTKPKEVFKVVTGLEVLFGITVYDEGIAFDSALWPLDKEFNVVLGGGWLKSPPDAFWTSIFAKAGY